MYTVKIEQDNTLQTTVYDRLIKSASGINSLHVLVKDIYPTAFYGDISMSDYSLTMIYLLPDATQDSDYKTINFIKSKDPYKSYVEYKLPNNTELTSQVGYVRYKFMLTRSVWNDNTQSSEVYIRETFPSYLYVYSNSLSDSFEITNKENSNSDTSSFANIGGLTSIDGKVYIVDTKGKTIGSGVTIEDIYISSTYAQGISVVKI